MMRVLIVAYEGRSPAGRFCRSGTSGVAGRKAGGKLTFFRSARVHPEGVGSAAAERKWRLESSSWKGIFRAASSRPGEGRGRKSRDRAPDVLKRGFPLSRTRERLRWFPLGWFLLRGRFASACTSVNERRATDKGLSGSDVTINNTVINKDVCKRMYSALKVPNTRAGSESIEILSPPLSASMMHF